MLRLWIAAALMCAAGCATAQAPVATPACAWDGGVWATEWDAEPNGEGGQASVTLEILPDGAVHGSWGDVDAPAGLLWGRIAGPDGGAIIGEWGGAIADPVPPAGAFLLQRVAPTADAPNLCRFQGFYTYGDGVAPYRWDGQRPAQ